MARTTLLHIVAYDVACDRRRTRVMNALKDVGVRVNYSVYECVLPAGDAAELLSRLQGLIRQSEDHIRMYRLCGSCAVETKVIGSFDDPDAGIINIS